MEFLYLVFEVTFGGIVLLVCLQGPRTFGIAVWQHSAATWLLCLKGIPWLSCAAVWQNSAAPWLECLPRGGGGGGGEAKLGLLCVQLFAWTCYRLTVSTKPPHTHGLFVSGYSCHPQKKIGRFWGSSCV